MQDNDTSIMLDFLRDMRKSAAEKRQEQLAAYMDGALTPAQQRVFEQELAQDAELRADLADLRQLQQQLRSLPQRRAPRQFTLDPARYGRPQRQPLVQLYPALRVATAMTAVFFIISIVAGVFTMGGGAMDTASAPAPVAMEQEEAAGETMDSGAADDTAMMQSAPAMTEVAPFAAEAAEAEQASEPAADGDAAVTETVEAAEMETAAAAEALLEEAPAESMASEASPADNGADEESADEEAVEEIEAIEEESLEAGAAPEASVMPTPDTPRVLATPNVSERVIEPTLAATAEMAAASPAETAAATPVETAPIPPRTGVTLIFFQVALGVLLLLLVAVLLLARRRL